MPNVTSNNVDRRQSGPEQDSNAELANTSIEHPAMTYEERFREEFAKMQRLLGHRERMGSLNTFSISLDDHVKRSRSYIGTLVDAPDSA